MKVKVEACWSGHDRWHFRCTLPNGDRFNVGHNSDSDDWRREYATEMRDYIVNHYDVKRDSIKVI